MELREIVPWGRSFDEYRRMFGLSDGDLAGRTLGCGDGPAGFNAEATAAGHAVVSCDPIYALTAGDIRRRVEETYDAVISQVKLHPERFVWGFFRDPDDLGRHRLAAMGGFLDDFERGKQEGRYVAASLPAGCRSPTASSGWPWSPTSCSCTASTWTRPPMRRPSRSCCGWPTRSASSRS